MILIYDRSIKIMKHWKNYIELDFSNPLITKYVTKDTLFFDIETTGFSPSNSQLYLIGCVYQSEDLLVTEQYFAETKVDEKLILIKFLSLLENYQTLISFNGSGFDLPYLKAKCETYQLTASFLKKEHLDLFKIVSSFKFLLKLPNYKQKSIETFLGIHRQDSFDGGQLISIYQEYLKSPNEQQEFFLKQHNYEDIIGMLDLLPILSYQELFLGGYSIASIKSNSFTDFEGNTQKELIFSLKNKIPVPKPVSCSYQEFYFTCHDSVSNLSVRLYEGERKFFFENYQDYYYLPKEDTAIHKDLASFVEKKYRKKATASTCYTKKSSIFLPQYEEILQPAFRENRNDKVSYFELSETFISSDNQMHDYISHILKQLSHQKE